MEANSSRSRAKNVMAVSGHRRNATAKFSHLGGLQYRQLLPDFGGGRMESLNVERHVFDVKDRSKPLHVEKARCLLVDAPKEAALARTHVHRGVHDPNHWQVGTRAIQRLRDDQLLASGHQGYFYAARIRHLARPRTSGINDDRGF